MEKSSLCNIFQISESLSNLQEEHKDLNARIEFERAEYEAELEMAQEETRNKEENIKVGLMSFWLNN